MSDVSGMRGFRVLALDGGGIKGAFTAAVLHELERMTGKRVVDSFDLITGTSTGGIIALGIGLGIGIDSLVKLYVERGFQIFPPSPRVMFLRRPRGLFRPKFRSNGLRQELEAAFGTMRLGESHCRLVIPAFNADDGDVKLIKTSHHKLFRRDHRLLAVDVALATSAAPTYFPAHQIEGDLSLIDGGVWANCPALVGVVEAITYLGVDRNDVDLLSVGTTDEPFDVPGNRRCGGRFSWVRHAPRMFMQASEVAAISQAELLTRRLHRWDGLLRLSPQTRPGRFKMDSPRDVADLVALGRKTAEHHCDAILGRFMDQPVKPFTPEHMLEPLP